MKKHFLTTLSVLALSTAIAGYAAPASATIVYVTVTGTIIADPTGDYTGLFGSLGATLLGDAYTAQYKFDTSLGDHNFSSVNYNTVDGGAPYFGGASVSPSLGASFTINGRTILIAGTYRGTISAKNSDDNVLAQDGTTIYLSNDMLSPQNLGGSASITTGYSLSSSNNMHATGTFSYGNFSLTLGGSTVYTESLSAPVVSSTVPEPASMALLGVGLLGTGVMARRRRQCTTTAC